MDTADHHRFMQLALEEARRAGSLQEVPVGAVLVSEGGEVLAAACNRTIAERDPSAHAEILALRAGGQKLQNYRLLNTTLYVTIEPCIMCMGAIVHARVARLVYGAADPKWGAAGTLYNVAADSRLNHQVDIIPGVCESECRRLIQDFFRAKRSAGSII
jgi:tRNA(adenine34) deaminase